MDLPSVLSSRVARAVDLIRTDLVSVFGGRLVSLVLYGRHVPAAAADATRPNTTAGTAGAAGGDRAPIHTLALVSSLSYSDLAACAARADAWDDAGLAMPLLLSPAEFASSLDVFPLEYGAIIERHLPVVGDDPFQGITVRAEDRRRACEVQAKSHLIHLREGFLQAEGQGHRVARLIERSIDSFTTLIAHLADLDGAEHDSTEALVRYAVSRIGLSESLAARLLALADGPALAADDAAQLYPPYLDASARVALFVDGWKETARA